MKRIYGVTVDLDRDPSAVVPEQLRPALALCAPGPKGRFLVDFQFAEEMWHLISQARAWGHQMGARRVEERGERAWSAEDARAAALAVLSPTLLVKVAHEDLGELVTLGTCPGCSLPEIVVKGGPLRVQVPVHLPWAFAVRVGLWSFAVVAPALLEVLQDGGASFTTAEVRTPQGDLTPYRVVLANVNLGHAVAPFGYDGHPCAACERASRPDGAGRRGLTPPRYGFYLLYASPTSRPALSWTDEGLCGPLLVGRDLRRALEDALTGVGDPARPPLNFLAAGWSPDDDKVAFLPMEFHFSGEL